MFVHIIQLFIDMRVYFAIFSDYSIDYAMRVQTNTYCALNTLRLNSNIAQNNALYFD